MQAKGDERKCERSAWTAQDCKKLFELQALHGNCWSHISSEFPDRSENDVKNRFYSTVRKGKRHLETYVDQMRRSCRLQGQRNRTVPDNFLEKVTVLSSRNWEDKVEMKEEAVHLSHGPWAYLEILMGLMNLAQVPDGQAEGESGQDVAALLHNIQKFCSFCRYRKNGARPHAKSKKNEAARPAKKPEDKDFSKEDTKAGSSVAEGNRSDSQELKDCEKEKSEEHNFDDPHKELFSEQTRAGYRLLAPAPKPGLPSFDLPFFESLRNFNASCLEAQKSWARPGPRSPACHPLLHFCMAYVDYPPAERLLVEETSMSE